MSSADSRLARTIIGRIKRYREGKTDLPALILELHLFVETYEPGQSNWAKKFQEVCCDLVRCVQPYFADMANSPPPDRKMIDHHLNALETILRALD